MDLHKGILSSSGRAKLEEKLALNRDVLENWLQKRVKLAVCHRQKWSTHTWGAILCH